MGNTNPQTVVKATSLPPQQNLYTRCPACNGTRKLVMAVHQTHGLKNIPLAVGHECPLCNDGYHAAGISTEYVDRVMGEHSDLLLLIHDTLASAALGKHVDALNALRDIFNSRKYNVAQAANCPFRTQTPAERYFNGTDKPV